MTEMKTYDRLVLHVPHASVEGLKDSGWPETEAFWNEVKKWTDWDTDNLFPCTSIKLLDKEISTVRFPMSRFVVDVERLKDDPMEKVGQGIIYRQFGEHHRELSAEDEHRLMEIYEGHHNKLVSQLSPGCLLIDSHSFPSDLSDVDVCIGFNEDWSRPPQEVIDMIAETFRNEGYKVGINSPYANSISPQCEFSYHSVMIELNKRIYWNERELCQSEGASKIKRLIRGLYMNLLGILLK